MFYICSVNIMQYIHYFIRSVWFRGFFFTCKLLYYELYYEKKLGIQTLHIENPSKELLQFFRKLREEKEEHKAKQIAKKNLYFPKSK